MSALFFIFAMLFTGCESQETPECIDNGYCEEGSVCINNACQVAECLESSQCEIGSFCDPVRYVCRDGCEADTDCLSGQRCDNQAKTCVDAGCRTTELDCPTGEICDQVTGSCYSPTPPVCVAECDVADLFGSCPAGHVCEISSYGDVCSRDNDCPVGWSCDRFTDGNSYCHQDYCLPVCNPSSQESSCPAGFSCLDDGLGGGYCHADCSWLQDNGFL